METLVLILLSNTLISLLSLSGALTLVLNRKRLQSVLIYFVSLSAGTLMGAAFFHLIPESIEGIGYDNTSVYLLISFIIFFLIEKALRWHHHHEYVDEKHTIGHMSLIGDSVHNFLDGLIIASSFIVDIRLGFITAFAVVLHEIPQEIGDFGVLLHSGYSEKKALIANLLVSGVSILGGFIGYLLIDKVISLGPIIMSFAAGGFIYIATSDLLPEIRSENHKIKSWISFLIFVSGIVLMTFFEK